MKSDYCNKCGECCKNIAVDFSNKVIYRDGIQPLTQEFATMLESVETRNNITICKCKFLKDNLCMNSNKPNECMNYPSSPFSFIPDDCGYYGEIFIKRENFMKKIRKYQEEIIYYEALIQNSSKDEAKQYLKIIEQHNAFINKYKVYYPDI